LFLSLTGCYVTKLAYNQNNLFNSRRLVSDVLKDDQVNSKTRKKLALLLEILEFAEQQGLNREDAYSFYIPSREKYVSYIVQASHADKLKPITWWFPIVGTVPYKGFFHQPDRDELSLKLKSEGYDVYNSGVGAFSSLGWFDDPIYPSMIHRRLSSVAHLFFHELTHRTFWWSGSTKFNENLAEYIAGVLTEKYLKIKKMEKELSLYLRKEIDKKKYKIWLKILRKKLKQNYANKDKRDKNLILLKKQKIFEEMTISDRPKFEVVDYIGKSKWNNARVLAASLYSPDVERFAKAFECDGSENVGQFLENLKKAMKVADSKFEGLDSLCKK